jgi:flagellar biosynthetic protein FliR
MFQINSLQVLSLLSAFVWPFVRILAMLSTAPVFNHKAVPRRVRVGLAMAIAILVAPLLPSPPPLNDTRAFSFLFQQIAIGIAMGFSMRMIFSAFEVAGDLLGLQMGLAFAQFIDPQRNAPSPLIGSFLGLLASLAFFTINGHLLVIAAIIKSFEIAPVSDVFAHIRPEKIAALGSLMFMLGLQIALPVMTALMSANIMLGVLARAAPQLNIMSIGFAITLLVGFYVLYLSLPFLSITFDQAILRTLEVPVLQVK